MSQATTKAPKASEADIAKMKALGDAARKATEAAKAALAELDAFNAEKQAGIKANIDEQYQEKLDSMKAARAKAYAEAGITGGGDRGPSHRCPVSLKMERKGDEVLVTVLDRESKKQVLDGFSCGVTSEAINGMASEIAAQTHELYPDGDWTTGQIAGWKVNLREAAGLYTRPKKS